MYHNASKYSDKSYVTCWYGDSWQRQEKQWIKELLQQTLGNELIHCQKLSGKTKNIQKTPKNIRPGPNLKILDSAGY